MRTSDLEEGIAAVTRVFCDHRIAVGAGARRVDTSIEVLHEATQPMAELSYGAPIRMDADDPKRFVLMQCAHGHSRSRQAGVHAEWHQGTTMPFSAHVNTSVWFERDALQRAIRIDPDCVNRVCGRWLGHPLEQPLRFALQPFASKLERLWQSTLSYAWSLDEHGICLPLAARITLDEYLVTLLLYNHPHNYTAEFETPVSASPGLIRRAEKLMQDNAETRTSLLEIAAALGVSLRSLQSGFRHWRNTTPLAYLREVRLAKVREELLRSDASSTVTDVALKYGFGHLGRFSRYYQAMFGEAPAVTLRRSRQQKRCIRSAACAALASSVRSGKRNAKMVARSTVDP